MVAEVSGGAMGGKRVAGGRRAPSVPVDGGDEGPFVVAACGDELRQRERVKVRQRDLERQRAWESRGRDTPGAKEEAEAELDADAAAARENVDAREEPSDPDEEL